MSGNVRIIQSLGLNSVFAIAAAIPKEPRPPQVPFRKEWFTDARGQMMSLDSSLWESAELRISHSEAWQQFEAESARYSVEHSHWEADYRRLLLTAPRDETSSPVDRNAWGLGKATRSPLWSHLCETCRSDARGHADELYPFELPMLFASVRDTEEETDTLYLHFEASNHLSNAWESVIRTWPLCKECPGIGPSPQAKKEGTRIGERVLEALAMYGNLSSGDLVALKIAGLTKNTVVRIMAPLVESGVVVEIQRGRAKFYSLPAA